MDLVGAGTPGGSSEDLPLWDKALSSAGKLLEKCGIVGDHHPAFLLEHQETVALDPLGYLWWLSMAQRFMAAGPWTGVGSQGRCDMARK